jgi:hypothetical protein
VGFVIRRQQELERVGACDGAAVPVWLTVLGAYQDAAWRLVARPDRIGQRAAVSLLLSGMHCAMMYSCSGRRTSDGCFWQSLVLSMVSVDTDHDKVAFAWTLTRRYSSATASSDKRTKPGHRIANRGQRPEAACTLACKRREGRHLLDGRETGHIHVHSPRAIDGGLVQNDAPTHAKQTCGYPPNTCRKTKRWIIVTSN